MVKKIARSEKMKLYNKIQELINESETLKQKNNEVLGLAKNELSELVKIDILPIAKARGF